MLYPPGRGAARFPLPCGAPVLLVCLIILSPVVATAGSEAEAESDHAEHPNKIALFGGVTMDGGDSGASAALEYTYRVREYLSIGGIVEYAGGDFDTWLLGPDFVFHPHAGWLIRLAPLAEFEHSETRFVFRVGAGYEFELSPRWALTPEFNVDLNRRDREFTQVFGISLVYGF